jgi:hypothetical protein
MLYSIENDGLRTRYWIIAEGERIQVPPEKIPQYTDHRPAALSLLAPLQRHPLVQCFIRGPEG